MGPVTDEFPPPRRRTWRAKFGDAARGARLGLRGQSSFTVHLLCGGVVIAAAAALGLSRGDWCLLFLCIALVLSAEMFNTALEHLSRAVDRKANAEIAAALDVSSAAVLLAALGASAVGAVVFVRRLGELLGWWAA